MNEINHWRKCSVCKKEILLKQMYYVCSVSTCNGQRTGYVFCSMQCFETHLPGANHRSAGAIEKVAPQKLDSSELLHAKSALLNSSTPSGQSSGVTVSQPFERAPERRLVNSSPSSSTNRSLTQNTQEPREVLIIASRLKEYISAKSDMNTSAQVMDVLSDYVRVMTDRAIENARAEGRKTVLDRDFKFLK